MYVTLLELLQIKLDRNEIEHDPVKNFLRFNSSGNPSFNAYLNSMNLADAFTTNEKICLEVVFRNHFVPHYNAMR